MNITNQLFSDLNNSSCEKDVENAYRACFSRIFGSGHLSSEYKTDGILNYADVHAIMEFKHNLELNTRSGIAQALIQVVYYLHNMADVGAPIPKVIFVGDINECFCMPMKNVAKYLKYDCDWTLAPSQAYKKNLKMYQDIIEDKNISPFIYDIGLTFDMTKVVDKMKAINLDMPYSVTITKKNIVEIFEKFEKDIIKNAGDDAVKIFFNCLLDAENTFIHPNKKNCLVSDGKPYKINEAAFRAFFSQFRNNYTPKEKDDLAACKDRVLEDVHRRMTGAFFTPPLFVDKAHEYIAQAFGDNWREEYVVYDMACFDELTEVLTDNGWKFFNDVLDSDLIYSLNPKTQIGEYVKFIKRQKYFIKDEMFHVKNTRLDFLITKNHNVCWQKRYRTDRPFADRPIELTKAETLFKDLNGKQPIKLPSSAELKSINDSDVNLDWLRLAGFYIGDGYAYRNSKKEVNAVGFKFKKDRKKQYFENLCRNLNIEYTLYKEKDPEYKSYRTTDARLVEFCKNNNGAKNKYIPKEMLFLPKPQLEALFEGLMQSDGCVNRNAYYTSSIKLADNFSMLATHLGYSTFMKIITKKSNHSDKICTGYEIDFKKNDSKVLKYNFIKSECYEGYVYDLTLEKNHILLTRRNGKTIFSGNCGTGNLTRDYNFKELYLSTLEQHDVDIINKMGYNKGATIFQYDFLNDDLEDLPEGLLRAMREQKKIIVLMNPPYGRAGNLESIADNDNKNKTDIAKTKTNKKMIADKIGKSSAQLYAQFIYRLAKLQDQFGGEVNICTFAPPLFLSGESFEGFRKFIFDRYHFKGGMLFSASNFADVKGQWGISFTVWYKGQEDQSEFPLDIVELNNNFELGQNGNKIVYSTDCPNSKWVREGSGKITKLDSVPLSSSINIGKNAKDKLMVNSLGYIFIDSNSAYRNGTGVSIFSSCYSNGQGTSITIENFNRCITTFCARKSIQPDWINCKDEYMVPDVSHPDYEQWNNDAIVYSLFNNSSQQSSLRQIDYKNKKWNIFNNFFFMSNSEMLALANDNGFDEMYQDAKQFNEDRYVYNLLQNTRLSADAIEVLNMAVALIKNTIQIRKTYHEDHPEYHLNAWDAGWAQMKPMFKEFHKEEYTEFVKKYKKFEDRMREGVYKFGFLKE